MKKWSKWRTFWHAVKGCRLDVVGWSIMGNPISKCRDCNQHYVTYGAINTIPTAISPKQARSISSSYMKGECI